MLFFIASICFIVLVGSFASACVALSELRECQKESDRLC